MNSSAIITPTPFNPSTHPFHNNLYLYMLYLYIAVLSTLAPSPFYCVSWTQQTFTFLLSSTSAISPDLRQSPHIPCPKSRCFRFGRLWQSPLTIAEFGPVILSTPCPFKGCWELGAIVFCCKFMEIMKQ